MKPLELTLEQKGMLLDISGIFGGRISISNDGFVTICENEPIHWYEFLMIHVAKKLLYGGVTSSFINEEHESVIISFQESEVHPIDTMYHWFLQKIK